MNPRHPLQLQDPEVRRNLALNPKSEQKYFQILPIRSPVFSPPSSNLISKDLDISDVYILVKAWRLCSVASGAGDYVVLAGKKIGKLFLKLSCVLCFQSLIQEHKY